MLSTASSPDKHVSWMLRTFLASSAAVLSLDFENVATGMTPVFIVVLSGDCYLLHSIDFWNVVWYYLAHWSSLESMVIPIWVVVMSLLFHFLLFFGLQLSKGRVHCYNVVYRYMDVFNIVFILWSPLQLDTIVRRMLKLLIFGVFIFFICVIGQKI